jgi:hypothetical protein
MGTFSQLLPGLSISTQTATDALKATGGKWKLRCRNVRKINCYTVRIQWTKFLLSTLNMKRLCVSETLITTSSLHGVTTQKDNGIYISPWGVPKLKSVPRCFCRQCFCLIHCNNTVSFQAPSTGINCEGDGLAKWQADFWLDWIFDSVAYWLIGCVND